MILKEQLGKVAIGVRLENPQDWVRFPTPAMGRITTLKGTVSRSLSSFDFKVA